MKKALFLLSLLVSGSLSSYAQEATKIEAEAAKYADCKLIEDSKYSGGKALELTDESAKITFTYNAAESGKFTLYVCYDALYGAKVVNVTVNGATTNLQTGDKVLEEAEAGTFIMKKGENTIEITPNWTWFRIDYISIASGSSAAVEFNISDKPVDAKASDAAKKVYTFLRDNFGKKTVSGIMTGDMTTANGDVTKHEDVQAVYKASGKYPALVGFDFMNATGKEEETSWYKDYTNASIELAKDLYKRGGIPAFTWHWRDPSRATNAFYANNEGDPLMVAKRALISLRNRYRERGASLEILSAGSTGYGEMLFHRAMNTECHVVETVGLIKMDFLGLKNLTIIKNAIQMIKKNHGVEIDIDHIPIDDEATYKLFCEGNTVGTFQFESAGMQKYLRELEPHVFEDLIAMNALYRPGPMDYIPDFIDRKQGRKPIEYDIPCMEKYLKDTYGITVYQEQVMLLSRQLAGFTRGQSDTLRKAMGKKQIEKMNELEVLFYQGGEKNGHPKDKLHKIWEDWKKFASYAFNKSHATCYSWVAYQTAYLKAHYPAEYMAAVMTSGQSDIKRTTELMDDCRRHGLEILPPSINESDMDFSVNSKGQIRFGLKAISGMGEAAADAIISEREKNGPYTDIFDLLERADLRSLNRKNIEALVKAGALDGIGTMHRAQYFYRENDNAPTYVEKLMRWALHNKQNADNAQMSIFDMNEEIKKDSRPAIPQCEEWSVVQRCREEFSVIGLYLSGHPLDDYRYEMTYFTNTQCAELADPSNLLDKDLRIGGIVTDAKNGISSKNGDPYGALTIEDLSGAYNLRLFKGEYLKFKDFFQKDLFIYIKGSYRQFSRTLDDGTVYHSKPVFKVYSITLLREVLDNNTKLLQFNIDLHDITPELCQQIQSLAKKHRGKTPMEAHIVDPASTLTLTMKTCDLLVSPRDMIIDLNRLPGIFNLKPVTHKF